jgi:hypothetical protein
MSCGRTNAVWRPEELPRLGAGRGYEFRGCGSAHDQLVTMLRFRRRPNVGLWRKTEPARSKGIDGRTGRRQLAALSKCLISYRNEAIDLNYCEPSECGAGRDAPSADRI